MITDRFKEIRKTILKRVFDKRNITSIWRTIVKNQLRSLDLKDIYDYYDFNYNIDDRATAIRNEILGGAYKAQSPLIYKIEKKLGICRHLMIPQPTDAVIMQVITEAIYLKIQEKQPSKNAFYSRDRHSVDFSHRISDTEYEKNWRKQWKKLQKKIYSFSSSKKLIAVTDLTNYFDSIDLTALRESILGRVGDADEVLVDLLFRIIEEISWKPDYLPYRKHGLPTINIESIRLLGHSFLFEIDSVLNKKTKGSFARWMDDITIGIDDKKEAIQVLSGISDVLKSRGLALNLSKTDLYNSKDAEYHFLIEANQYLDHFESIVLVTPKDKLELRKRFKNHLKDRKPKYWDKVTKRFITTFGRARIDILSDVKSLYINTPGVRSSIMIYLSVMGYSKRRSKCIISIFSELSVYDDISLFYLCRVLTNWNIPINSESESFLKSAIGSIAKLNEPLQFYCLIWIKSKYSHPEELLNFIIKFKNNWSKNAFLRRQVTAILSRLYLYDKARVEKLLNDQINSGIIDAISVANQILSFVDLKNLDKKLSSYLFPSKLKYYSLERFLVLSSVLNSDQIRNNKDIKDRIKNTIRDAYYKRWLDVTYNIH